MRANPLRVVSILCSMSIVLLIMPPTANAYHPGFEPAGAGGILADAASGLSHEQPSLNAFELNGEGIQLDGILDDSAWLKAEAGWGFMQMDPERGAPPSEKTLFKVAYDDDAIYFGVACYENDPGNTSSALSRRDNIASSDFVDIYLDPYFDQTSAFNFRINPHGVEEDSYIDRNGDTQDRNWDAVWHVETTRDEQGWCAELRIPFSSLRYRQADSMTWGLQVSRWMHGRGEDASWANWDRESAGLVSRFGTLRGIRGIRPPRQLEVLPYMVARNTDPSQPGSNETWDDFQNFGADIKYGITADLTMNATLQPDFGQVEADPALLNLSPFETFYDEKRPFFVEGGRFFQHPHFNLFYSRRIGTGTENSRIRFASKLLGKTAGDVSVAMLVAATDETEAGKAHNPFISGKDPAYYAVGRFGKDFADGRHQVNVMQTVVLRGGERSTEDNRPWQQRDAYSSGLDFNLNFLDRRLNVQGSFVGSIVDPKPVSDDPGIAHEAVHGTAGALGIEKRGGTWRGAVNGSWETDKLDLNDIGFLQQPDQINADMWVRYNYNSDGGGGLVNSGFQMLRYERGWIYAAQSQEDPAAPGETLWAYGSGLPQVEVYRTNGWWRLRNFWSAWYGIWYTPDGLNTSATRGGPPIIEPEGFGAWSGFSSDWRKDFSFDLNFQTIIENVGTEWYSYNLGMHWVQSNRVNHSLALGYDTKRDVDQWVGNFEAADPAEGLGGVHYVFGHLDRQIYDLTLRSNVLFNRDQSLELYVQPFLAVGDYSNARELMRVASHELAPYAAAEFDVADKDFSMASMNLNLVYRWEYRPGSTFYLVWSHGRGNYERRAWQNDPDSFDNGFDLGPLFDNEAENTFLAKVNYWFAI